MVALYYMLDIGKSALPNVSTVWDFKKEKTVHKNFN